MHPPRITRPPVRGFTVLAGAAIVASVLAAAGCGRSAAAPGAPVPASAIPRLTAIARWAAALNGDPHPAWITAVLTTRAKALTSAAPGDYVPGSARVKVFLITMRGHFTAGNVPGPPGAKAPAGRYLSLVIDAKTFQGLDFGISPKPPPVPSAGLGPVTHLTGRGLRRSPPLSARVLLPSQTISAGSPMTGHVLVDNTTGHAIHVPGCLSLFQVLLTSSSYRLAVAWPLCLQRFTIPAGLARNRVTVRASYSQCSQARPRHGLRACLPGGRMPPLPPGTYHARLFQAGRWSGFRPRSRYG
jgi:hypothetical protein